MIVEVQGMGFWTRVRLPSTPLKLANPNTVMCSDFVRFTPLVITKQGYTSMLD